MTARIVITDYLGASVTGSVEKSSAFITKVFTFSNFDNTGVAAWRWTLLDRGIGSAAVVSSDTASTTQVTADIAGGYLVRLQTYRDAGATILDDQDEQLVGVAYATPFDWQIPAAGETIQRNAKRGWAQPVEYALRQIRTSVASLTGAIVDADFAGIFAGRLTRTGDSLYAAIKDNILGAHGAGAPTTISDAAHGYQVGSLWANGGGVGGWICVDSTNGAAVWHRVISASDAALITTALQPISIDPLYSARVAQDFLGPPDLQDLGYGAPLQLQYYPQTGGVGALVTWAAALQSEAGHPGTVSMQTGTTNTGYGAISALFAMNAASRGLPKLGGGVIRLKYIFKITDLATGGEDFKVRVGSMDAPITPASSSFYFEYDRATSLNWRIKTVLGAHASTSSVPVTAGGYHLAEIECSADGQTINFYMDGALLGSFTDAALAAGWVQSAMFVIEKTGGTTSRSITADYCDYFEIFTNPRA